MLLSANVSGLGDPHAQFNVYIANIPKVSEYSKLNSVTPLSSGEVQAIGQACGNGWRKVFNVYAKLVFALSIEHVVPLQEAESWQNYRDNTLLQHSSNTSLLFSPPQMTQVQSKNKKSDVIHIIMGKGYANSLVLPCSLKWLDDEFALDYANKLLVCPYFDYRQLSNLKIIRLVELINQLRAKQASP